MKNFNIVLLFSFLCFVFVSSGFAKEGLVQETPVTKLETLTTELMEGLSEKQLKQFAAIRLAHGVLRSVREVETSLGKGVSACAQNNPEMKDDLEGRYRSWKSAVRPVFKKGEDRVGKMIILQEYAKPSEVRHYLTSFDAAVAYREKNIEKKPVTEKKACEKMLKKMDDTELKLVSLITEALGLDRPLTKQDANRIAE